MMIHRELLVAGILGLSLSMSLLAQTARRIMGAVTEIQAASMKVKPDSGEEILVGFLETTKFLRVAPGERDLTKAAPITQADIGRGDRILAVFSQNEPNAVLRVVVMSQTDIAAKQEKERLEWQKRGISGVVSGVDKGAGEIKIRIPSMMGGEPQIVAISTTDKTRLRRYAPDSIRFADAKAAKLEEIKPGDQLRGLGEKSADGTKFTAEEVVTGAFKTIAATVVAVNETELQVKELNSNKPMTIVVAQDSTVKRFPQMGPMGMGGAPGGQGGPGGGFGSGGGFGAGGAGRPGGMPAGGPSGPPSGAPGGPGMGPGMGPGGGRRPDFSQMVERLPKSTISEIKAGEMIIVASTQGAQADRLTAITLLANADNIIRMQQMMAAAQQQQQGGRQGNMNGGGMGAWNLGEMSMPMQ